VTDLVEFIRARLDEDERLATRAATLCGCHPAVPVWRFEGDEGAGRIVIEGDPHPDTHASPNRLRKCWDKSYANKFAAEHIVNHDPARVLREVEAKRALLAACVEYDDMPAGMSGSGLAYQVEELLALPYADHPDYRPEWSPS